MSRTKEEFMQELRDWYAAEMERLYTELKPIVHEVIDNGTGLILSKTAAVVLEECKDYEKKKETEKA